MTDPSRLTDLQRASREILSQLILRQQRGEFGEDAQEIEAMIGVMCQQQQRMAQVLDNKGGSDA